jgi:hypothetical protein
MAGGVGPPSHARDDSIFVAALSFKRAFTLSQR